MSEEARLRGGKWIRLLPEDHQGIMEIKWGRNKFIPFIVIDPEEDPNPRARDAEEMMSVISNVTMDELDEIILSGDLALTAVQTSIMARSYLKKSGLL